MGPQSFLDSGGLSNRLSESIIQSQQNQRSNKPLFLPLEIVILFDWGFWTDEERIRFMTNEPMLHMNDGFSGLLYEKS